MRLHDQPRLGGPAPGRRRPRRLPDLRSRGAQADLLPLSLRRGEGAGEDRAGGAPAAFGGAPGFRPIKAVAGRFVLPAPVAKTGLTWTKIADTALLGCFVGLAAPAALAA